MKETPLEGLETPLRGKCKNKKCGHPLNFHDSIGCVVVMCGCLEKDMYFTEQRANEKGIEEPKKANETRKDTALGDSGTNGVA